MVKETRGLSDLEKKFLYSPKTAAIVPFNDEPKLTELENHNTVLQSPKQISSKPTPQDENSEAQLVGVDHHN